MNIPSRSISFGPDIAQYQLYLSRVSVYIREQQGQKWRKQIDVKYAGMA